MRFYALNVCQDDKGTPFLYLFAKALESSFCTLPKVACSQKFAFAQRSGAMKAPVGLLSDRTVLRSKMEGPRPDKFGSRCTECRQCKEKHGFPAGVQKVCKSVQSPRKSKPPAEPVA